jgi:hypothetical protein
MTILKLDSSRGHRSGKSRKLVLGIGGLIAAISIGYTLASNININSGPVEFGQGVAQTVACDDSISISPMSSFVNSTDTSTLGSFMFTGIQVSDVDSSVGKCQGKTLTFKAYADTETADLATYTVFVGDAAFLSGSGTISDSGVGTSTSSFTLTFDPATISASDVYKITVESSDGFGGVPSGDRYFDNEILYIGEGVTENGYVPLRSGTFFEASGMPDVVLFHSLERTDPNFWSDAIPLTNGSDLAVAIAIGGDGQFVWNSSGTYLAIGCHSDNGTIEQMYRICPGMTTDYEDNGVYVPTRNLIDADIDLDYSGILTVPNTEITYGSAISTVTTTVETYTVQVKNTFTLERNSPFLKVTTRITNTGSEPITNLRAWALNGDQMVGDDDADFALKNISSSGMSALSGEESYDGFDANSIKASTNEGSAIMYSSTADAAVLHYDCCSLQELIYMDPLETELEKIDQDGSYGLYFRLDDLGAGASHEFTWFFGATTGSASNLAVLMHQASRPDVYRP